MASVVKSAAVMMDGNETRKDQTMSTQPETITTIVHPYRFSVDKQIDAKAYAAMCDHLLTEKGRPHWMNCWALEGKSRHVFEEGQTLELETAFVFENQWNTACGKRVFDWFEEYVHNESLKQGYWLEQTAEMHWVRESQYACGWCGARYWQTQGFCSKCLDSPYLKEKDLYLLRLKPMSIDDFRREPLTPEELSQLLPLFEAGQANKREKVKRNKVKATQKRIKELEQELVYVEWLADNGFDYDNWIYYPHTEKACFGWHTLLSKDEAETLDRKLQDTGTVPFVYEIKLQDGGVLR